MEIYEITLMKLDTRCELSAKVEVDEAEASENITIFARVGKDTFESANYAYLSAYQEFRDKLLVAGYGIRCNGSRLNAVQSAMMSATDQVYLVEIGKQAFMKDIVHIWDYADIDIFPDTKQQNSFLEQWTKPKATTNQNMGKGQIMNKDFPLNRFDFSNLIKHIEKESLIPNIIVDTDTGIEFYGADTVSKEILINILENFNLLDNLAQNDSKQQYEKHTHLGVKSFQFEPSWVQVTPEKIVVGYVGIYINTDFDLTFVKINGVYTLIK